MHSKYTENAQKQNKSIIYLKMKFLSKFKLSTAEIFSQILLIHLQK